MNAILSGQRGIVIGTRSALFAPIDRPSLIVVIDESSGSYRIDEGFRYQVRDVAVMRGFLEKISVLLTSSVPSVETSANIRSGKYRQLVPATRLPRPRITIIDERSEKKVGPDITRPVHQAAQRALRAGRKVLIVLNRKGYAPLISCSECGHTEECPDCRIPAVLYKDTDARCRYCGRTFPVPVRCSRCGGHRLELLGSGTERVQESFEELSGIEPIRIDKDTARTRTELGRLLRSMSGDEASIAIGTTMLMKNLGIADTFGMAAVLNADAALSLPDFRASEKAITELAAVADRVDPSGEVCIQTRHSGRSLYRALRSNRYEDFIQEELELRKTLRYPPYTKMVVIRHCGDAGLSERIVKTVSDSSTEIEILGPADTRDRRGRKEQTILLKHKDRTVLNKAARAVLDLRGARGKALITIDVDPS